jgi:hypothetical protein
MTDTRSKGTEKKAKELRETGMVNCKPLPDTPPKPFDLNQPQRRILMTQAEIILSFLVSFQGKGDFERRVFA